MMSRSNDDQVVLFTEAMKHSHTILVPQMLPIHFQIMKSVLADSGYRMEVLENTGGQIAQKGLKYVHNDTCYPALLIIGQMIDALQSGHYDLEHVALIVPQSGGGCRASNYIHLLRKALRKAGMGQIPVISLNMNVGGKNGTESSPGFSLSTGMLARLAAAVIYGDELMLLSNQLRPYEANPGDTDRLLQSWIERISAMMSRGEGFAPWAMTKTAREIASDFAAVPVEDRQRVKVGIVGEIYVRYSSLGNNDLEAFLQSQNCECNIPGLLGYIMFSVDTRLEDIRLYGGSTFKYSAIKALMAYLTQMEKILISAIASTRFVPPGPYQHKRELVDGVIGHGSKMGEGWMLTAEMLELIEQGYPNIVCTQPFGCLPNHINGRGMMNRVKEVAPQANIVAIDYDPGAARVNQENRIKLMLSGAPESAALERQAREQPEQNSVAAAIRRKKEQLEAIPELLSGQYIPIGDLRGDHGDA